MLSLLLHSHEAFSSTRWWHPQMNDTNTLPPTVAAMYILTSEGSAIFATTTGLLVTVTVTNLEIKKQALYLVLWVYKRYILPSWSSHSLFQDQVNVKTKKDGSPLFLRPILVTSHTFNLDNSGLALPFHTCIYILEAINYHTNTRGSKGLGTRLSSHRLVVWSNFSQTDIVPAPMGSL